MGLQTDDIVSQLQKLELSDASHIRELSLECKRLEPQLEDLDQQLRQMKENGELDNLDKLHELSDAVLRHDSVARVVPRLVHRLRTLQSLHELGADVMTRLNVVEKRCHDFDTEISTLKSLLDKVSVLLAFLFCFS